MFKDLITLFQSVIRRVICNNVMTVIYRYESHCPWHNACICVYSCHTADTVYYRQYVDGLDCPR